VNDAQRSIDMAIEVAATPEQVWEAIATGPGVTSWYVPHEIEPRAGGAVTASFGPAPEMQVTGRVAAWEPPHRIVFDGGDGVPGLAFEWHVEGRDGGMTVVRLVNSGFGSGAEWDGEFDAMTEGWRAFFANLRLHLTHFAGQAAVLSQPTAMWAPVPDGGWPALAEALGIDPDVAPGDRVEVTASQAPRLSGTVATRLRSGVALLLDDSTPGTALLLAESHGPGLAASVWTYRYGPDAQQVTADDAPRWAHWLQARAT